MSPAHRAKIAAALTKAPATEKVCPRCKESKPVEEFALRSAAKNKRGRPYRKSLCRVCDRADGAERQRRYRERLTTEQRAEAALANRTVKLRQAYGITVEEYDQLLAAQGGGCAICGATTPGRKRHKYLAVDHCHESGTVRGILCDFCNTGLGSFRDDPALLLAAIKYLGGR